MKKKKLKVFTLPIEEFEKKYPVSYSIVVPGIPEGHVAKEDSPFSVPVFTKRVMHTPLSIPNTFSSLEPSGQVSFVLLLP